MEMALARDIRGGGSRKSKTNAQSLVHMHMSVRDVTPHESINTHHTDGKDDYKSGMMLF